jgi:hypothetical protein
MMIHPDDHDALIRLCKAVAVVWICVLCYKMGKDAYYIIRYEIP